MEVITALRRRGFLASAWPWRSLAYLVTSSVPGALALTIVAAVLIVGGTLASALVGLPMLAALAFAGVPVAAFERWRLRLVDTEPVADPHRVPDGPGVGTWLATRVREPATWRELGFTVLLATVLWPMDLAVAAAGAALPVALLTAWMPVLSGGRRGLAPGVAVHSPAQALAALPAGIILLAAGAYLITAAAAGRAALTRRLLSPRPDEAARLLAEVTGSRARLVNAFEAERRRIERDLHDGAQQRLVAIATSLGLALLDLPPGPAADHVAHAHRQSRLALTELRELIHGIHPQVLTQHGLAAALQDAADRSPLPVDLALDLTGRLPAPVEATGYFIVCEALANIARHSDADRAWITLGHRAGTLLLEIGDDGVGGADPAGGSGLTGLSDRLAVIGGVLTLSSPPGGPTVLKVELPCPEPVPSASSSPKTAP
ncbi:sensor histidine kinase [Actinoallomurus rhizosphaericola]|uniref:sensor histidine kinase n=1 Tax=Actinoallomurus rhizosphaericola TaxID=2952536 RepID=UPI00209342CB|nr:sensor histidine kinase [Actinoallomurus rhizosphaericola]MCO5999273.1 sensor domain-containing protein [Actinoallomurus rhizosphaericola]